MRQVLVFSILLSALAWLAGCKSEDSFRHPPPATLAGKWVNPADGSTLNFQDNNRFELLVPGDKPRHLTGWAYYPQSGHVSLEFDSRLSLCSGTTGIYTYKRDDGILTLSAVQDDCPERKQMVDATWEPESSGLF
ncbi:hypothetical protein [Ruficoccus sp. ZRK36]|uniref:hypothetical protein n=1 Tax=Ruficoccus sp. ZRK36 TaxID=2866311 RepID=UPI001C730179|nr:hypothetical protein [Ruficoccus sp. ZRK36]QYY36391.1 hypothetical protein K0V07_02725 [Ruficoccus sp. ZRK36]